MSRQLKTNNYAYGAGLIDGEGCVSIRRFKDRTKKKEFYSYGLSVCINMTDGRPLDFMYGVFGGNIVSHGYQYTENRHPSYRWEIHGTKAKSLLKKILPFLRLKKSQAELGIRFQSHIDSKKNKYGKTSNRERQFREWAYNQMKDLKKDLYFPRAAAETECEQLSLDNKLQSNLTGIVNYISN